MERSASVAVLVLLACLTTCSLAQPVFTDPSRRLGFIEENVAGAPVRSLASSDAGLIDLSVSGSAFEYFLTGPISSNFDISAGGRLTVTSSLDREITNEQNIELIVELIYDTNLVSPSRITIDVTVLDVNDNAPVNIPGTISPIYINENALLVGFTITLLDVTDLDQGTNAQLTYVVVTPTDLVGVNPYGRVFLRAAVGSVDQDTNIDITISVSDGGDPAMHLSIPLILVVENSLELPPQFSLNEYIVNNIDEAIYQTPVDIVTVMATRHSFGASGTNPIRYNSIDTPPGFVIDSISGRVTFQGTLDRETQPILYLTVTAVEVNTDDETVQTSRLGYSRVQVALRDINDNEPIFFNYVGLSGTQDNPYRSVVSEAVALGHIVVNDAEAFDPDEGDNNKFTYSIMAASMELPFSMDSNTGIITTDTLLDYEGTQTYTFIILATETVDASHIGSATVIVDITNVNDNSPAFPAAVYRIEVNEGPPSLDPLTATATVNTDIITTTTIVAIDNDLGDFSNVYYALHSALDAPFSVGGNDGKIYATAELDREMVDSYHMSLIATDDGGLSATTLILVIILDLNDETPTFRPDMFTLVLIESTDYANALTVFATDGDKPGTVNTMLSYTISPVTNFGIDLSTGVINAFELDCEVATTHTLIVTATDAGTMPMPLTGSATINVRLQCLNELGPVFIGAPYASTISESLAVGQATGVTASATDSEGHSVLYAISPTLSDGAFFNIDETSGVISLALSVDRDPPNSQEQLMIEIYARDDAAPPRTSSTTVTITVGNANDNTPIITNPPARDSTMLSILEDSGPFPFPYPLFTVDASDLDIAAGDSIIFSLTGSTHFSIDQDGLISHDTALDRETSATEQFTISACDSGNMCDTVDMTINVLDYNDNAPVFTGEPYTPTVTECDARARTSVVQVSAADNMDIGPNREIEYQLLVPGSGFAVDQSTGVVYTEGNSFDFESGITSFTVTITAIDNPSGSPQLQDETTVTVTLTDCNDNTPVFGSDGRYTVTVADGSMPAANPIYTGITVNDLDSTVAFQTVTYVIDGGSAQTNNWINIDSSTGHLNINPGQTIDREDSFLQIDSNGNGVMVFSIVASNTAPGPFSAILSDSAVITVVVEDVNDNDPIFQNTNPLQVFIVENAVDTSIVAVVAATDADTGTNAHIRYTITSGNDGTFQLDAETGHLTVAIQANLDRETNTGYTLAVQAENDLATGGTPATLMIEISVTGTNDHSPIFGETQYMATLAERNNITGVEVAVGAPVDTVLATDQDEPNTAAGMIEYRILTGNMLNVVTIFDIADPIQGAVVVLRPDLLNYEERTQWDLVIEAYDLVSPITARRQDSTHLIINIMDLNDNVPMFTQPSYSATIVETELPNTVAMLFPSIRATDLDAGGNDPLTYTLASGIPFTITADGTSLIATQPIDHEAFPSFNSVIRVQDDSGNEAVANLTIEVIDINDNAPRFLLTAEELTINIPENLNIFPHPDSIIRTVEAEDADEGENARITYRLSGGRGNFDITQSTGVVRLIAPLDRDTIASRYTLNVTATDGLHTSWRAFIANIENINDNNPEFLQAVWEGTLAENAPIGNTLLSVDMSTQIPTFLQLIAEDLDPESNVTYKLSPNEVIPNLPFRVTFDGYIETTANLDREVQERYSFKVQATDGFRVALTEATVDVVIGDVNDESPQFQQPSYAVDVYELTPMDAIFLILQANDADIGTNSEITYRIATDQGGNTVQFAIDMTTGALSPTQLVNIGGSIDTTIVLVIEATDKGTPSAMRTPVNVQLTLVDRNLEAPAFTEILYEFSADENVDNVPVGTVIAMDSTGDQDAVITYSIVNGHSLFVIDAASGFIRSVLPLDREGRDLYTFTISAIDSAAQPRTGFATVVVTVDDINDNDPFFDPESYPVFVSENTMIGTTVVRVMAFDNDAGPNAELTYSIFSQNPGDIPVFGINQMGEITTLVDIDREDVGTYNLMVQVTDSSVNPRTTLTDVMVTVNDVNDNTPMFVGGAVLSGTPVEIPEDAEPGTLVTTLLATDEDFQLNGIVGYYFDGLTRTRGPFQIDRDTGEIRLRPDMDGALDREIVDFYELPVIAADLRGLSDTSRSASGIVRVQVLDINDNLPTFLDPLYEFAILESFPLNTPYGEVMGIDLDVGLNAALNYFFIGEDRENSSCSNQFCVDQLTGELVLVKTLDHEGSESHLLTLAVTNSPILEFNETTGMAIAATTGTLSVSVIDANDNGPVFVQSTLFAAVAEEAQFGTTITTVEAIDSDSLNGSIVWFEIVTPQVPYLVDRDTGVVTTAGVFSGLSGTRQEVTMRAYDNFGQVPTFSSMGIMIVQVYKETEQVIITFSRDKEVVEAKIGRILAALEEVTSARVTITEVRVEVTDAGEVDISGTDVVFFTLDPSSGNVINPSIIVRRIDQNYAVLDNALSACKVERIRAFNSMAATSPVPVWLWVVLAILAAGVLCMCCCFLIGCVVERRRSRRWKKKATQSVDQYATVDYSAFNDPLWVSPYDGMDDSSTVSTGSTAENSNPLYESQELTIEMFQDDGEEEEETKKEKVTQKSRKPVKAPPLTIPGPVVKRSDGMYDSQEIEIEMYDELDDPESDMDSNADLIRSSTPSSGLAGKRGGKGRAHYSRDDELLDEAVGGRHGRSYF